jgi:5-methylcytosine-specific restriction enzyme A
LAIWLSIRRQQLQRQPLCAICTVRDVNTAASEVDHVVEHRGSWNDFICGELQSLCSDCHRSKSAQAHKKNQGFNEHGEPLDLAHPWYKHG